MATIWVVGSFLLIGLGAGFVLQRSRLCFVSGLRDLFLFGATGMTRANLVLLLTATAGGAAALWWREAQGLVTQPYIGPASTWAVVAGGALFGFGMVLAGSCAGTSFWRLGEGQLSQFWILAGVTGGTWLYHMYPLLADTAEQAGLSRVASALVLLAVLAGLMWWEHRSSGEGEELPGLSSRPRWQSPWPPEAGAVVAGLLLTLFLALTGETWRVTRSFLLVNWSDSAFVLGLVGGGYLGARFGREWRLRSAGSWPQRLVRLGGGLLMGYGGRLAWGCTIGLLFSGTAMGSLLPWLWLAGALPGAWLGALVLKRVVFR